MCPLRYPPRPFHSQVHEGEQGDLFVRAAEWRTDHVFGVGGVRCRLQRHAQLNAAQEVDLLDLLVLSV